MKNNSLNILLPILFAVISLLVVIYQVRNNQIRKIEYSNDHIQIKYDTTWKVEKDNNFSIKHKKSDSTFKILVK